MTNERTVEDVIRFIARKTVSPVYFGPLLVAVIENDQP
jgi:hypothetical protein